MKEIGNLLNPNTRSNGVNGKINVAATTDKVAISKDFPGRLCKIVLRLRITNTTNEAEITDSMNQPVLKRVIGLSKTRRGTPKAR